MTNANRQVNVVNKKIWQIIMKTIFRVKEEFTVNTQYCSWYNYGIQGNFFRMIFFSVTLQKFKVTNGLSQIQQLQIEHNMFLLTTMNVSLKDEKTYKYTKTEVKNK